MADPWQDQREVLGAFIRNQRQLANLSLRQLAEHDEPVESVPERGRARACTSRRCACCKQLADALNLSAEALLARGWPGRCHGQRGPG